MFRISSISGGNYPIQDYAYARPGSEELAEVTCEALGDGFAAIRAHHGLITVRPTIDLAFVETVAVESTADTIIMARSVGKEPIIMPDDEVKILREMTMGYKLRKS